MQVKRINFLKHGHYSGLCYLEYSGVESLLNCFGFDYQCFMESEKCLEFGM